MAVLTRDDLMSQVQAHFGEATDDASLQFIEDISDTIKDLEDKAKGDGEDWKTKYEENDKAWREKYRERFFSSSNKDDDNNGDDGHHEDDDNHEAPKTFEELFSTK